MAITDRILPGRNLRRSLIRATLIVGLLGPAAPLRAGEQTSNFFFKPNDRIVFLGDSITEQYQYSSYMELFLTTRFPSWNLTFLNAGISGDTAAGGAGRFATHVLAEKPTAVTIDFGMNDGGYGAFNPAANKNYVEKTRALLKMAKQNHLRAALVSPNAVERRNHPNLKLYLETQKQFYAPLKELADEQGAPFVDQYSVTRAVLEKLAEDDPAAQKVNPFPDGVHTEPSGGLLMAHTILVGLHAPALVSDVHIDAAGSKAVAKECAVDRLQSSPTAVTFDRTDRALPLPVQKDWRTLLPYVNNLKDLNWYGLTVTGLADGRYALLIDGNEIGGFTANQLAKGVNLGNLAIGPIHDQGTKVLAAINAKNQVVHQRFRGVVMFRAPDWLADVAAERRPTELVRRMEQIDALQAAIYRQAKPVAHHFELKQGK